jgi:hypothetical protein
MADIYASIESTFKAFLAYYEQAVKTSDPSVLTTTLSPTCLRQVVPAQSMKDVGEDATLKMNNETYLKHMGPQFAAMEDGKCEIKSLRIDGVKKSAVGRVQHHCKLPGSDWIFVEFEEDGKKIKPITKFSNTHGITKFVMALRALVAGAQV